MYSRRCFIKQVSAGALLTNMPGLLRSQSLPAKLKIWGCLLHLSFNMWEEYISPHRPFRGYQPDMNVSESLWNEAIVKMSDNGINMVVIDLGNAVRYDSHPEIAVNKAWSTEKLREELKKLRKLGLEPIPKLNFSAGHDTWMGKYSRMVSTDEYYKVCSDLITEVCSLFEKPRFFHLGMDEESASNQSHYNYIVVRQNDVWWNDFYFLVGEVEKQNSRAWIWSDYMLWNYPEQFFKKMPKSVIQSNWYYGENFPDNPFDKKIPKDIQAYLNLEAHGYDQIPTGSFHDKNEKNILNTVQFCEKSIDDARLLGFLQTFWKPTIEEYRAIILKGIDLAGGAREWFARKTPGNLSI